MSRTRLVLAAVIIAVVAFGSGYLAGGFGATHPAVLTGSGYVGADQASLTVGDTTYSFQGQVRWTDGGGTVHLNDWPTCLPHLQQVTDIRFVAATIWASDLATADVVWVDCRGH